MSQLKNSAKTIKPGAVSGGSERLRTPGAGGVSSTGVSSTSADQVDPLRHLSASPTLGSSNMVSAVQTVEHKEAELNALESSLKRPSLADMALVETGKGRTANGEAQVETVENKNLLEPLRLPAFSAVRRLSLLLRGIQWLRMLQVAIDAFVVFVGFAASYLIRFDGNVSALYLHQLFVLAPIVVILQLAGNWIAGVYRRLWRYTGLTEVMEIGATVLFVTLIVLLLRKAGLLTVESNQLSYGIIFVNGFVSMLFLCSPRIARRLLTEHDQRKHWRQPVRKRALVVGAGEAGLMVLRELSQRSDIGTDVVGLIDDDPSKLKKKIGTVTVFGSTSELPKFIDSLFIDQVIIAMPSAPPSEVRRIVEICRQQEVETRILPGLFELIDGKVSINQLREVSLEDLLGRDPVQLDTDSIAGYVAGRCVLVTGAGGSIGSELCRQIVRFRPHRLILLGKGENSIFSIQQELARQSGVRDIIPIIADVRDARRMQGIFEQLKPQVVFHAAAHKHVPLMESNVSEAVANNVFGTKVVAELSAAFKVETFVLVSSDKAVNPTSIMGATKRAAELVVQDLAQMSSTKYVAVRFGNVLASRGSVIPLWKQQISQGGPITVTHPEATRYFMLIPEAVQLILQAGALGNGGEIFVLDMGKPVKILDLANDLIRLSGLSPGVDIEVKFIGMRPGEKLYEELLTKEEGLSKTLYEKIFVGRPQPIDKEALKSVMDRLREGVVTGDDLGLRDDLDQLVGGSLSRAQRTDGRSLPPELADEEE